MLALLGADALDFYAAWKAICKMIEISKVFFGKSFGVIIPGKKVGSTKNSYFENISSKIAVTLFCSATEISPSFLTSLDLSTVRI